MMYLGEGSRDIYLVECSRGIYISDNLGEPSRDWDPKFSESIMSFNQSLLTAQTRMTYNSSQVGRPPILLATDILVTVLE